MCLLFFAGVNWTFFATGLCYFGVAILGFTAFGVNSPDNVLMAFARGTAPLGCEHGSHDGGGACGSGISSVHTASIQPDRNSYLSMPRYVATVPDCMAGAGPITVCHPCHIRWYPDSILWCTDGADRCNCSDTHNIFAASFAVGVVQTATQMVF